MFGQNEDEIQKEKTLNMTLNIKRSNTHNRNDDENSGFYLDVNDQKKKKIRRGSGRSKAPTVKEIFGTNMAFQ